jgi:16S rRNA (adenine1518-N6/adenine1519-N6)-dimethyltransferase
VTSGSGIHPRRLLQRHSLHPKKSLGQNFLVNEGALRRIVGAADLTAADMVLEIGPGLGALTRLLAEAAGRVVAVELDDRLIPLLESELAGVGNVELIQGDILELDPAVLVDVPYKVVANLPYYITAPILRHFLEARVRPEIMVLTVQREVAERLTAKPGRMSLLAVSVQYYGRVTQVARIKAGSFFPRPEVDSAVVRIDLFQDSMAAVPAEDRFFRVVKAGFSQKRKQLRNSLRAGLGIPAERAVAALEAAGIDPRRRAETLSLEEWAVLAESPSLFQAGE